MSTMADLPAGVILLDAGYSESFDDSGSEANMRFEVPASVRNQFLQAVAGLPQTFTYGSSSASRLVPLKHPDLYNCYASSIRGSTADGEIAFPTSGGGIGFAFYRYDVKFNTPKYAYDGNEPLITVQRGVGSEMVTLPGTSYRFPSDGRYISHDVGVPITIVRYALTFHRVPALNNSLYDSLAGKVSSTSFRGAGAGQTLYLGCSSSGQQTMGGQVSYEPTHEFEIRSIPWNQIMRPDGGGFEAPVRAGTNEPLIPTADLNQLYG